MREDIKLRIETVRRGEVPTGYATERAMLFPLDWGEPTALNTVLTENKDRNEDLEYGVEDVLSVSGEQGVVNQIELLGRSYAGESIAPYHIVETGDVVYTKSPLKNNPYGIVKQNRGKPGVVSTLYAVYHCDSPITGQYLENYFCIDTFLNNYLKPLVKRGAKNDMKVNNEEVLLGRIPLPPLEEREKINGIIAQFDRVIELKQQLLDEKRKQKQWLMQKLMDPNSGVRLPGFKGNWKFIQFDEIALLRRTMVSAKKCETGTKCIELEHIESSTGRLMGWCLAEEQESSKCTFGVGDVLFGKLRPYLRKVVLAPFDGVCSSEIWVLQPRSGVIHNKYLFYIMQSERFIAIANTSSGTKMPRSEWSLVQNYVADIPDLPEQEAIVGVLLNADREAELLKDELDALQQKKKALMQLLLTGLVRVNA